MPEGLALALATQGLVLIMAVKFLAGLTYGFAGFGAALIFIPLSSLFVPPQVAVGVMAVSSVGSLFTVFRPAWAEADRTRVMWMLIPAFVTLTPGVWLLGTLDVTALRWIISAVIGVSLVAMITGYRRAVAPSNAMLAGIGGGAGLVGGLTGLTGPVVILFNLSGREDARIMRANTLCFLTLLGTLMIPQLTLQGLFTAQVLWLGLIMLPVYIVATWLGRRLFDPRRQGLYRGLGYAVIAGAVLVGLPLWD
ncbi:hypothetical protein ACMU_17845 [Actibacterium mucosum KCTC 23349]|uniref:Probable membrane transporter protein n=1 Tax=Actibacterium mucosum KCTC 23349 TaxID=1454373 RepID=A0A037ZIC3_9RHOB|nr:sulfite exporter TauE/SafE family protein [Actibacterium mucosum]KAJ54570.1 hypothetical protein ACMU_17845 [Actibacterium mucosum KCTC 23349]